MSNFSCSVISCENRHEKTKHTEIKYFSFPKNPEIAEEWVKACSTENINLNHDRVCSIHFKKDCFIQKLEEFIAPGDTDVLQLSKFAVPTENLPSNKDASCKRKQTILDIYFKYDKRESKLKEQDVTIDLGCNDKNNNSILQSNIQNRVSDSSPSASNSSDNLTNLNGNHCSTTEKQPVADNHYCGLSKLKHKLKQRGVTIIDLMCNKNDSSPSQDKIQNHVSDSSTNASDSCVHMTTCNVNHSSTTEEQTILDKHFDLNKMQCTLKDRGVTITDLREKSNCKISESQNEKRSIVLETENDDLKLNIKFLEREINILKAISAEMITKHELLTADNLTLRKIITVLKTCVDITK